jgi:hypothetical protein
LDFQKKIRLSDGFNSRDALNEFDGCNWKCESKAPKARRSTAQGEDRRAVGALGWSEKRESPEGAKQASASPLQGFLDIPLSTQGFGCCAASTLGCAAPRFQRLAF